MGSSASSVASRELPSSSLKGHSSSRRTTHRSPTHVHHNRRVDEPPPPYVQCATQDLRHAGLHVPTRRTTEEDILETLSKFDTVFIVDDSTSMRGGRWSEARNALSTLAELAGKYDVNGIDVHFLNHEAAGLELKSPNELKRLFETVQPKGATPIGNKLEELSMQYLSLIEPLHNKPTELKKIRPVNFVVITDGYPTDDPESVIVQVARRLDDKYLPMAQVGIQFVQIGDDRSATQYLQQLDDALAKKHRIRDIVDTTPYTGALDGRSLLKILLGGINRRVDIHGANAFSS